MTSQTASSAKSIVDRAISQVGDIATLPEVTVKIIEIVEDPKATARDLHEVIKNDPALSTKVLKVVNSAFYGLPGQIATVDRAVVLLGLSAVKNIAIASSIARMFKSDKITESFSARDLWKHSLGVGVTSRLIAKAAGQVAAAEEVFLAGLIHDLGILIERQAFPDLLAEVTDKCAAGEGNFVELERLLIGADHQAFSNALATKWKFPRNLRAVVGYHHDLPLLSADLKNMVSIVHVADALCCQEKIGFYLTAADTEITDEVLSECDITTEDLEEVCAAIPEDLANAESMLME